MTIEEQFNEPSKLTQLKASREDIHSVIKHITHALTQAHDVDGVDGGALLVSLMWVAGTLCCKSGWVVALDEPVRSALTPFVQGYQEEINKRFH